MNPLWILVLISAVSTGLSKGSDPESITDLNKEEARHTSFLRSSDSLSAVKFQCHDKPSGYYADPRFDCKIFHFCHEDGTRQTIPCTSESGKHNICLFRDITFNACEGSEIYLALPEDLHVKPPKDTTTSAVNIATDYKLSNVLPVPNSPSDIKRSTTPLSLELEEPAKSNSLTNSKEIESIFEVFNTVLREIQAGKNGKSSSVTSESPKLNPSIFGRGSKFQTSPIRRDDSDNEFQHEKEKFDIQDTYLVEVSHKGNEKLLDKYYPHKKSKRLFFLPKLEKKVPATYPRRRKRTVTEALNPSSRPYAIIYAKVPEIALTSNSKTVSKNASHRKDIIEVPFVAARVPADVPTVPVTIETRRKKKSKSKKKAKNVPINVYFHESLPRETGKVQTSEQRNVAFFSPNQATGLSLEDTNGRTVVGDRQRSTQNSEQSQRVPLQNSLQSESLPPRTANPLQLQNFPFQPTFLSNSAPPQFYFGSGNLQQPGNFPAFGPPDQFALEPQLTSVPRPNSFRQPDGIQTQSIRPKEKTQPQVVRPPKDDVQHSRQNNPQIFRKPESIWVQNIRQTGNVAPQSVRHMENIPPQPSRETENRIPQNVRKPENNSPQPPGQRENHRPQSFNQPESIRPQIFSQPGNMQHQILRQPETIQPLIIRQPKIIQPQTIRQLPDDQLRNRPGLSFREPQSAVHQTIRLPQGQVQSNDEQLLRNGRPHNTPSNNEEEGVRNRGRQHRYPDSSINQRFSGFNSPFFQNFPSLGSLRFNGLFTQPGPQTYELRPPPGTHFQGELNVPQHANHERPREQVPHQLEKPLEQELPQYTGNNRPQNSNQQQYPHNVRQQVPAVQPETSISYLHPTNQNQNLVEAEKIKQERPKPERENAGPQILIAIPQSARPLRNRARPSAVNEHSRPQSHRQRNRDQPQREAFRSPQENNVHERPRHGPQHHSNRNSRRPQQQQHPQSAVVYRQQRPRENSVDEIVKDDHHHTLSPSTVIVPDFNVQVSPQSHNIRNDDSEINIGQRYPRQKNRNYYRERGNEITTLKYSTDRYVPTTPIPSSLPRQRSRRPEKYIPREIYQTSRPFIEEPATTSEDDRPFYRYRSSSTPYERPRTSAAPYEMSRTYAPYERSRTSESSYERPRISNSLHERPRSNSSPYERHRTTPSPYERHRTTPSPYERHRTTHSPYERPRTTPSPYERPRTTPSPYERPRTTPSPYERPRTTLSPYERPRTTHSPYERPRITHSPYERPRTTPSPYERPRTSSLYERPRTSSLYERPRTSSLYERPRTTSSPYGRPRASSTPNENQRTRTSPPQHHSQGLPVTSRYFVTPPPRFRPSELEYTRPQDQNLRSENYYDRQRIRPQAQIEGPPSDYANAEVYPEENSKPQRYHSYSPQHNHNTGNNVDIIPTIDDRLRVSSGDAKPGYRETLRERQKSDPEIEHGFLPVTERPPRQYSQASRTSYKDPELSYREPENGRVRKNRYQNYEEVPTTRQVTTPKPTKKPRPPPPRPTFPAFPTFPPPPRRITTSPKPVTTEDPEQRRDALQTTDYMTEGSKPTRKKIQRTRSKEELRTEISEAKEIVTESYLQTDVPEVTTRRRGRKRKSKGRRPKTTTSYPDDEDVILLDTITQATTRKVITTRSTPSNYNRWRQQTSESTSTETSVDETPAKPKEYGSRLNLFGRPRTRKPALFVARSVTTTTNPEIYEERRRASRTQTTRRKRKPFTKRLRKKTTTETPETTEQISRSDENDGTLHLNSDINSLQSLESVTQLFTENTEEYQPTQPYNDAMVETAEESTTLSIQDEPSNTNGEVEDFESTRSVSKKFQKRPRILKFGKPRLRATDSPLDLNAAESKIER